MIIYRYEVHTFTLCDGWINCWTTIDPNGIETPESYKTINDAQAEIEELIADVQAEIDTGIRGEDEGYSPEDYRIFDRKTKEYVS